MRGFYHDDGMIKVITGVRRCGKSCLMQSIADELVESGVASDHIIYIDLDSRENRKVKTTDELENLIDMSTPADTEGTKYLFIDEIQNVKEFELLINGYRFEFISAFWAACYKADGSLYRVRGVSTRFCGIYRYEAFSRQACQ